MIAEDKKKKKYKSIVTTLLENNPITGPSTRIFNLLKSGKKPSAEIATALGLKSNTVTQTLNRHDQVFQKFGGYWGLKQR